MIKTVLQHNKDELRKACVQMRATDWFERYVNHNKGTGSTIALVQACKKSGATLVTYDAKTAEMIAETHGIKTTHVHDANFAAHPSKSMVDHFAIQHLVREGKRVQKLGELLLAFMDQKGMD